MGALAYRRQRDLLDYVENIWRPDDQQNGATVSKYDYTNDPQLGLRTGIAYSGVAFGSPNPPITQTLVYNARNELTSSIRSDLTALARGYTYDPIGNRISMSQGASSSTTYESDPVYEQVMTLSDVIADLRSCDEMATIYAAESWSENCRALVAREPEGGGLPSDANRLGLT